MPYSSVRLSDLERHELAPRGRLDVGIAVGQAVSAVWTRRRTDGGRPEGPTVILAEAIAQRCGLDLNLVEFDSSGQIISHATDGSWSLSFVPIDDERRRRVGVGPAYYAGVSTYLVRAGMGLANVADVDSPSVRVVGVEGTATLRSAVRSLTNIVPRSVVALDEAVALFVAREVDAIALGRESIQSLLGTVEGAAMVSGHFHKAETAVIVPRGRPAALAATERLMKTLKEDGTIDAALSAYGLAP